MLGFDEQRLSLGSPCVTGLMNRRGRHGSKADENGGSGDSLAHLRKGGAFLMVCRTCGKKGDFWTSRCQYNDLAAPDQTFVDKPTEPEASAIAGSRGSYFPPSMRAGAERPGVEMHRRNDENSVRVTNLSEDAREPTCLSYSAHLVQSVVCMLLWIRRPV
ncbi:hypothetical protein QQ045_006201 [Rhodiola kirilowii]